MMSLEIDRPLCASELARAWNKSISTVLGWIEYGAGRGRKKRYLKAIRLGGRWCITPEIAREFINPDAAPEKAASRAKIKPDPDRRRRIMALLGKA